MMIIICNDHGLTLVGAKESNWAMTAFWFFIHQPDVRKHWVYVIPIRYVGPMNVYH